MCSYQPKSEDSNALQREIGAPSDDKIPPLFEVLVKNARSILQRAANVVRLRAGRNLVIHTQASSEPELLASIQSAVRNQKRTSLFQFPTGLLADTVQKSKDFQGRARRSIYQSVAENIGEGRVGRILVVPSCLLDIAVGIAAADITGAPMALLLISDEPLGNLEKTTQLVSEAFEKADLIVMANKESRSKLQLRFGEKIWPLPRFGSVGFQSAEDTSYILRWIWDALLRGQPPEEISGQQPGPDSCAAPYVDPPAPKEIHWEMRPHFLALQRLKKLGYAPDFIVDVGASTGYWSHICQQVFPNSRFYLFEPLLSEYQRTEGTVYSIHPEFKWVAVAVSNRAETITFNMAPDLYGSSFLADSGFSEEGACKQLRVPAKPLSALAPELGIKGNGLMKIDVQFAEHLVLEGAKEFLDQIDVIFVELSLGRLQVQAKTFPEMLNYLRGLGFEYFDVAGWWRDPQTGQLLQQDAVFTRRSLSKLSY